MKIGQSKDVHRLVEGRDLIIGGVKIDYEKGLLGHSDADVLTHAIIESLIGAMGLKDIGTHFPDNDPKYEGISSMKLLEETRKTYNVKVSPPAVHPRYQVAYDSIYGEKKSEKNKSTIGFWIRTFISIGVLLTMYFLLKYKDVLSVKEVIQHDLLSEFFPLLIKKF